MPDSSVEEQHESKGFGSCRPSVVLNVHRRNFCCALAPSCCVKRGRGPVFRAAEYPCLNRLRNHEPREPALKKILSSISPLHACQEVCVSGGLAPFDEVSVSFRGPMNLYNIAWFEGTADGTLERTTSWTPG